MQTNHSSNAFTVKIIANDRGNPPGKLADAELLSFAKTRLMLKAGRVAAC